MSKTDPSGMEHGRRGNVVYVVLGGKQVKKSLYSPSNPRTPAQQKHRAKLAYANRLSAQLADAVNIGFAQVAEDAAAMSPRNAFVKANWANGALLWDEAGAAWTLDPQRLLLATGPRYIGRGFTAALDGDALHIACSDLGLADRYAVDDDQLMLAIYMPEAARAFVYEGPLRAFCAEGALPLPDDLPQGPLHVYAWFRATGFHRAAGSHAAVRPGQCSDSVFLGTVATA